MEHTVKAYGEELNNLTAEVVRLGGLAEAQVADVGGGLRPAGASARRSPGSSSSLLFVGLWSYAIAWRTGTLPSPSARAVQ